MSLFIEFDGETREVADGAGCTVGRRGDLRPNDITLSKVHFRVAQRDGGWWIEDAGSASGTWVDGGQLRKATLLKDGAEVRAGRTTFTIRVP